MNEQRLVYLDYNATTPCAPEVIESMIPFLGKEFANASSAHAMGRTAASAVANARQHVASAIGCSQEEVFFTSGATESNNMALLSFTGRVSSPRRLVVSAIEHKSVLGPCEHLKAIGIEVVEIPVTRSGVADVAAAEQLLDDNTGLVSIQGANNEIGTLQPVRAIADLAHAHGALVHCDATQMLGKIPVSVDALGADLASFSAHKTYGPKGIGALFIRSGLRRIAVAPLLYGGGQELELRPGTLNVPAIVGFGEACRLISGFLLVEMDRLTKIRDRLEQQFLRRVPAVSVNGAEADRLPGTSNICFPGVPADVLIARTPDVCVGVGSACTSGTVAPSHVLVGCGQSSEAAACAVRFSLGRYTTEEDLDFAIERFSKEATSVFEDARDFDDRVPIQSADK